MKKVLLLLALCASFTMVAQETMPVRGIFATKLAVVFDGENNTFTFMFHSNMDATEGSLVFYDENTGDLVGALELNDVKEGPNVFSFPTAEIPGQYEQRMNWGVTLGADPVTEFALVDEPYNNNFTYTFNTVDNNPESDFFGRIYVGHRPGTADANNGLWMFEPDFVSINEEVIKTRSDGLGFRSNFRLAIDSEGKVYMPDWGDPTSGVYVFDPANQSDGFKEFFRNDDGSSLTRNSDGLLTNAAGEAVAGSSPGVAISGMGADTKLYVYNEDVKVNASASGNNVSVYNIGDTESIMDHWNQPASQIFAIGPWQANGNGNIVPDEAHNGIWVSQVRAKNQNNTRVPSLIFVNNEGDVVYNSGNQSDILNGSQGAGFAITRDGQQIAISDGDSNISFFDITWNEGVPSLTFSKQFAPTAGIAQSNGRILQMNFDYGGNLILSGAKVGLFSVPTEKNQNYVPAKKDQVVKKNDIHDGVTTITAKTKSGVRYNLMGQPVDENYKGIVIQDGKKFIQK